MRIETILPLAALALYGSYAHAQEKPTNLATVVSFCDAVSNPASYDGKVISIRAKVSDEFEDFTLFDAGCYERPDIWIELGGNLQCKAKWEAMGFVCNPGANLRFRGVEYLITRDENLDTFLKLLGARQNKKPIYRVTATLTGTFFGVNPKQDKRLRAKLPGYGHMGCCFQLIVNQISDVASSSNVQDRDNEWKRRLPGLFDKKAH